MKKSKIQNSKPLSDARLKELLADLREEVAAPAGFRSQVMRRVEAEMGIRATAQPEPSWLSRFAFFKSPAFMGLAASLALAFGFWLAAPQANQSTPETQLVAQGPSLSKPSESKNNAPVLASASESKNNASAPRSREAVAEVQTQKLAPAPAPQESVASVQTQNSAPLANANGGAPSRAPLAQASEIPHFAGGASSAAAPAARAGIAEDKPIIIEIKPTATPLGTPLRSSSELRRNLFHPAKGEYASLLFNLARPDQVRAEIFNRLGQRVAVLADGQYPAGLSELRWLGYDDKGQDAPAGIYLLRVRANGMDDQHKAVVVR